MAKSSRLGTQLDSSASPTSASSGHSLNSVEGWKHIADLLPQLVWILRADGSPEFFNRRWYDFTGIDDDAPLSDWQELIHKGDRPRVTKAWEYTLKTGHPFDETFRIKDGRQNDWRWFLGRGIPLKDGAGHITHLLGTSTDIHEQKLAQEHQRYLSEASEILSSSLDYDITLKSVADILVPHMADWFGVDLAKPGGGWESAIVSHVDPKKVAWAKSLSQRFPQNPDAPTGTAAVFRTGKTEYYPYISNEMIDAIITDPEQRRIVDEIGFTSVIAAPMNSCKRTIGVLSLVSAESGRRYTEEDVRLVENLADRIAMAIDNARLYQQEQEELRLREAVEIQLRELNRTLEERVMQRTEALQVSNRELVREVEERQKAEMASKRQATLLNLAHEAIFTRDMKGRISYWNAGAERLYGYTKEEVVGKPVREVLKSVYPISFSEIEKILEKDRYWEGEIAHTNRQGKQIPIFSHWTLQRDQAGKPSEILEINIDISERKASEQELIASQRRFATAVTAMQEGVVLQDVNGVIELANEAAATMLGLSLAEIMGHPIDELPIQVVDDDNRPFQLSKRPSAIALETGTRQHDKIMGIKKGKKITWMSVNATPLVAPPQKKPTGVLVTYTDITERRQLEEERQIYAEELERSNRELQDFASVASHDLQEPLRKIRAFSDRLIKRFGAQLDDEGVDYLERMQLAAERMQQLINDLLTYSRVTTRAQPFKRVSLKQILADVLVDMEATIEHNNGQVKVGQMVELDADPTQMRQLLQNLIANGLKFHRPERPPVVEVSATHISEKGKQDNQCCLVVKDNGIGIDPKYYDRIFQMFQRLHGREDYTGTGVGLAVARKIVDRHHGSIEVESKPGRGAQFKIYLPITQPDGGKE